MNLLFLREAEGVRSQAKNKMNASNPLATHVSRLTVFYIPR